MINVNPAGILCCELRRREWVTRFQAMTMIRLVDPFRLRGELLNVLQNTVPCVDLGAYPALAPTPTPGSDLGDEIRLASAFL